MTTGIVYLVGAGPGDPELISVKGRRVLAEADCVIYDYLADQSLVRHLKCELIYVGKQGSNHTLRQEEISELVAARALEGKKVVRLKGGDPFIFGRGGEEAELLFEKNVPFEVVPGISSFYSAPAYAGIPLTHRDFSSAFEVISGHRRSDADETEDVNFPEYNPEKTFAFLMGMKNLSHISNRLINEKNFPPDTPVGIVTWGTKPEQRVVTASLHEIAAAVEKAELKPPAIIIMGGVVSLREKLRWFDKQPLFGKKIVVTRTREQASKLTEMLVPMGARVIEFPTIEIKRLETAGKLFDAISAMSTYSWIVFTSQNAVNIFFDEVFESGRDARVLGKTKIAAIGKASAEELKKYGLSADLVPPQFVAESLLEEMKKYNLNGQRILIPCSADARTVLAEGLKDSGADVNRIHIYKAVKPEKIDPEILEQVKQADIITFTSSSTVTNFFEIVTPGGQLLASIGPVTSKALEFYGSRPRITASEYTVAGLVQAMIEYFSKEN